MASYKDIKNNNPKGFFKFLLAMDSETSGVALGCDDPSFDSKNNKMYQSLSWGFIVLDASTLKEVDRMYIELKPSPDCEWDEFAEKVHKLSKTHLEEKGLTEEEAVIKIASLILKYWGPDSPVSILGHNVNFDLCFLKRLMRRQGVELKFSNRIVDTNSIGLILLNTYTSDQLFEMVGLPQREIHNALEDIEYTVEAARRLKVLFTEFVKGTK